MMIRDFLVLVDAPVRKDVASAIAGASAAAGGLILVFLGMVVSGLQAFGAEVAASIKSRFEGAIWALFLTFALSLVSGALAVAWLATGGGAGALYEAVVWAFFALLALALGATGWTIFKLVL